MIKPILQRVFTGEDDLFVFIGNGYKSYKSGRQEWIKKYSRSPDKGVYRVGLKIKGAQIKLGRLEHYPPNSPIPKSVLEAWAVENKEIIQALSLYKKITVIYE